MRCSEDIGTLGDRHLRERAMLFIPIHYIVMLLLLLQRNENRRTTEKRVEWVVGKKNTGEIQSRRNPATVMTARTVSRQFILICEMN